MLFVCPKAGGVCLSVCLSVSQAASSLPARLTCYELGRQESGRRGQEAGFRRQEPRGRGQRGARSSVGAGGGGSEEENGNEHKSKQTRNSQQQL